MTSDAASPPFPSIAIVGVGLIGGSIAAAVKQRGIAKLLVGVGRSRERLQPARDAGLLDVIATELDAVADSDLVIICTPVDRIIQGVLAAAACSRRPSLVTDAGSVKKSICDALSDGLPDGVRFVGSHPLAGSEKTGWEHADANLFEGRLCVVTPHSRNDEHDVRTVEEFWRKVGMSTRRMSPEEHDRALALTSHLPHAVASALASLLPDELCELTATGFRDTTRIAAGEPSIWTGIFLQNSAHLSLLIDQLVERLLELRECASRQEAAALHALLADAKRRRDSLAD